MLCIIVVIIMFLIRLSGHCIVLCVWIDKWYGAVLTVAL